MSPLTPPYQWIRDELARGRVIPFLGAGASLGARNPDLERWRQRDNGEWRTSYLPTATELADALAADSSFPADESRELAKVSQYFGTFIGRSGLRRQLHDI